MLTIRSILRAIFRSQPPSDDRKPYTPVVAGPGVQQNGPYSVIIAYDAPPEVTSIGIKTAGCGGP